MIRLPCLLFLGCSLAAGCRPAPPTGRGPSGALTAGAHVASPGADRMAVSIRRSLSLSGAETWGEVLISLDGIRNHSHASREEFAAVLAQMANLLNTTNVRGGIPLRFVAGTQESTDYELVGAAYLMTAQGFDLWELYVTMRPAGETWMIWSADGPVRLRRQPRPGEQRMGYGAKTRSD